MWYFCGRNNQIMQRKRKLLRYIDKQIYSTLRGTDLTIVAVEKYTTILAFIFSEHNVNMQSLFSTQIFNILGCLNYTLISLQTQKLYKKKKKKASVSGMTAA